MLQSSPDLQGIPGSARSCWWSGRPAIGDDGVVTVSKAVSLDAPFAEALGPLLAESDSDEDHEAYRRL